MSNGRRRHPAERRWWLACVTPLALAACSGQRQPAPPLPPPPSVVTVRMYEYGFDHRQTIPAGRAILRVANAGTVRHELLLVRLPDDLPGTLDEQLRSSQRRPVETVAMLAPQESGEQTAFAADLGPGHYGLICYLRGDDEVTHALKGMNSDLYVSAANPREL